MAQAKGERPGCSHPGPMKTRRNTITGGCGLTRGGTLIRLVPPASPPPPRSAFRFLRGTCARKWERMIADAAHVIENRALLIADRQPVNVFVRPPVSSAEFHGDGIMRVRGVFSARGFPNRPSDPALPGTELVNVPPAAARAEPAEAQPFFLRLPTRGRRPSRRASIREGRSGR
jgi:hypothetical protein